MRQVTLVAFYGQKPAVLRDLICSCQEQVTKTFGDSFKPYVPEQVHATLIGLERRRPFGLLNRNLADCRGEMRKMDLVGFRTLVLRGGYLPFTVQVGGFQDRNYPFTSRGNRPFERSFSIQGDKAVMMGWPVRGIPLSNPPQDVPTMIQEIGTYPDTLDAIRRAAQAFNIYHSWHKQPADVDNDFYFRLGLFGPAPKEKTQRDALEKQMREFLLQRKPVLIEVRSSQLQLVVYEEGDELLPLDRSAAFPLDDDNDPGDFFDWPEGRPTRRCT